MTRKLALPVRCYQTEGIPSLRAPGFCKSLFFEYDMVNSALLEQIAGRESRLSTADHHDGEVLLRRLGNEPFHDVLIVRTHGAGYGLNVKDANGGIARKNAGPFLDGCQLSRCRAAGKTELCAHAVTRRRESFAAASKKFRDRHFLALAKVLENNG